MRLLGRTSCRKPLAASAIALTAMAACAATPRIPAALTVGEMAPAADISHWIKGEEVAGLKPGQVYVLEFWATWCGPCRANIPHLSRLQDKYGDNVTIIGVSTEKVQKVVEFLCTPQRGGRLWNDEVRYTLATDPDGSVKNDYMQAAGRCGIPTAFIIGKDGRIAWIGHPKRMDNALETAMLGSWDPQAAGTAKAAPQFQPPAPAPPERGADERSDDSLELFLRLLIVLLKSMDPDST